MNADDGPRRRARRFHHSADAGIRVDKYLATVHGEMHLFRRHAQEKHISTPAVVRRQIIEVMPQS